MGTIELLTHSIYKPPIPKYLILTFLQTDTYGWLEGHIREQNYGADWGHFVSFQRHMKQKARRLGVDLLVVDTGDLHDGNGLSDSTSLKGVLSNPIHEKIEYDLLTIGQYTLLCKAHVFTHRTSTYIPDFFYLSEEIIVILSGDIE